MLIVIFIILDKMENGANAEAHYKIILHIGKNVISFLQLII